MTEIVVTNFSTDFYLDINCLHYTSNVSFMLNRMSGTSYLLVVQKKQPKYLILLQSGCQKSLGMKYKLLLFYPTMQICQLNFISMWKPLKPYLTVQNLTGDYIKCFPLMKIKYK